MRKARTIEGSYGIDAALIVFFVQKLTGRGAVDPIAISSPFLLEPFFLKGIYGQPKMPSDPL